MLKSFPEHVLPHARQGVIAPSALGQAARAEQIESAARRRASDVLSALPDQVDAAKTQARRDGFSAGYADAIAEAVPLLAAALNDVQALREAVLGKVREVIAASLAAEGVEAALVVRRCEQLLASTGPGLELYVPGHTPELGAAVLARLAETSPAAELQVLPAQTPLPILKAGPLLFELDPVGAMAAAVETRVDADALEAGARERAAAYIAGVRDRLTRLPFPESPTGMK